MGTKIGELQEIEANLSRIAFEDSIEFNIVERLGTKVKIFLLIISSGKIVLALQLFFPSQNEYCEKKCPAVSRVVAIERQLQEQYFLFLHRIVSRRLEM